MGQDKAFLMWREKPLWLWQAELMREVGMVRWVLSCRREQGLEKVAGVWSEANGMDLVVSFDPEGEAGGMMEALDRGMQAAGERALVLSVDMPEVKGELIGMLDGGDGGCLFEVDGGPEPFPGVYTGVTMEMILSLGGALRGGLERCARSGLTKMVLVPESLRSGLGNWNRPGDVRGEG